MHIHTRTRTWLLTAQLFTKAEKWKRSNVHQLTEGMGTPMRCGHTTQYDSVIKGSADTRYKWVNFENIRQGKRSHERPHIMIPFTWNTATSKSTETEGRLVVLRTGDRDGGNWERQLTGTGLLSGVRRTLQFGLWWVLHSPANILKTTELYILNGWIVGYVNYESQ